MSTQFSLFEGDAVNRLFASVGVGSRRARDLAARSLLLVGLTWVPLAVLALLGGDGDGPGGENFFKDIAAYMQLLLGLLCQRAARRRCPEAAAAGAGRV